MSHSYRHPGPDKRHAPRERGSRTRVRHRTDPGKPLNDAQLPGHFVCTRGEIGKRRRLKSGLPARVAGSSPAGCTIALCAYFLGVVAER